MTLLIETKERMTELDSQMLEQKPTVVDLGPVDHVPEGQGRCFVIDGKQLAVFRLRDGQIFAIDNVCPHRAGPLSAGVIGIDHAAAAEAVVCPFHGYKFSLRDGRGLDTDLHVRTYRVEIRGARIFVALF